MKRDIKRSIAAILAILIVSPSPGLWAATIAAPAASRSAASGMVTTLPALPASPISQTRLGGLGTLTGPALNSGLSAVPQVNTNASLSAAVMAPAANAVPLTGAAPVSAAAAPAERAPAAVTATEISAQVDDLLKAAGPVAQASAETAYSLGDKVFMSLAGAPAKGADDGAVVPDAEGGAQNSALRQQKMLATLYQVASVFAEQYAPLEWKQKEFQLDLKREYDQAKARILADPRISTREFQDIIYRLTAAMKDYHVSVSFHSTERAVLPFAVTQAGGKYFLAFIDREKLPETVFPFQVGDEVVAFNGVPTAQAVRALAAEKGGIVPETDLRLAELFLTNRRRSRGDQVPQGRARIILRTKAGKLAKVIMPWDYIPELVAQDVPGRDAGLDWLEPSSPMTPSVSKKVSVAAPAAQDLKGFSDMLGAARTGAGAALGLLGRALDGAIHPLAGLFAKMRAEDAENPYMIGAKKSFVPYLGKVLWQTKKDDLFHAYIFQTKDGRKAGFIRIPTYDAGYEEAKAFAALMKKFQAETDALVIDQVSNPGGSLFYLYALVSHLTGKPLTVPRHRLIVGEGDAHQAAEQLIEMMREQQGLGKKKKKPSAKEAAEEKEAKEKGVGGSGYPLTPKFIMGMLKHSQFVLNQFNSGKRFTDAAPEMGVDAIDPAAKADERYTKPILLLTNALDFSGGDFFPAILQDNGRAVTLGVRTSGAGGMVRPYDIPNQFGIGDLHATWSIAERPDGRPIENLGVTPDIPYEITEKDMRTGFAEYRLKIIQALNALLGGAAK
jgi:hypothetical protein